MTEIELFDKLNPKRDLPQATCDVISQVYKVMQKELTEKDKQIAELRVNLKWEQDTKSELAELLGKANDENAELRKQIEALANVNIKAQNIIGEAKDLIRNILRVTYGEGWNYSLDWKVKAEQFLNEVEK